MFLCVSFIFFCKTCLNLPAFHNVTVRLQAPLETVTYLRQAPPSSPELHFRLQTRNSCTPYPCRGGLWEVTWI